MTIEDSLNQLYDAWHQLLKDAGYYRIVALIDNFLNKITKKKTERR